MQKKEHLPVSKPGFSEALRFWFKLGFISFGGPAGQISIMHEYLVVQKKWISDGRFLHALNYCMILPGPEAQQLATYLGWLLHGVKGGIAAGLFFILPSVFILLGSSLVYVYWGNVPAVMGLFEGLKPAVVAIILLALIKIGKKSLLGPVHYVIAILSFISIFQFNLPFPLIIISTIIIGILLRYFYPESLSTGGQSSKKTEEDEASYYLNKFTIRDTGPLDFRTIFRQVSVYILIWAVPLVLFYFTHLKFDFWQKLTLFFTKSALVTFGGAYAVLPYVAQVSVEKFHWLSSTQMIDGLALGETTPGPLIMVLAFVGFMAGYHHFGNSLLMGTVGLLTTTFYTFLPSFAFILIGAPFIEKTRENARLKEILNLITASVFGVVLNLSIYLAKAVAFSPGNFTPNYPAIFWIIISFIALYRFKINMIVWIGISAAAGLLYYFVRH
ncbi:chromate efflux transporter [Emticicia sp. CRIBPO]|uniref:chromate efflux transporter n=1 Tax=Emticicia sp. CRIBPO TaxID=2683258 RepID=UPI0014125C1D|nr:chromate efflux transporter [Emticicia sp. CRIBPO]NBA84731.1 chromate efflux transporter [Emticicia sp. CRIBPO]